MNNPEQPAWLHSHAHEPNPSPPSPDPALVVQRPDGSTLIVDVATLQALPSVDAPDCYIVSTGHGTSGPFTFRGVRLLDLLDHTLPPGVDWQFVDVISGDGFGTRITAHELQEPGAAHPILLSYALNGKPMTRSEGLVRLIVPSERDDALRQVKWVGRIEVSLTP